MDKNSVIFKALKELKARGAKTNIVLKDKKFYNGEILLLDAEFVQVADRYSGPVTISLEDISMVRESNVVGGGSDG